MPSSLQSRVGAEIPLEHRERTLTPAWASQNTRPGPPAEPGGGLGALLRDGRLLIIGAVVLAMALAGFAASMIVGRFSR